MQKKQKVFIPDSLHLNPRNFKALDNFLTANNFVVNKHNARDAYITYFGNYLGASHLQSKVDVLKLIQSPEELSSMCVQGANLFEICKAELLSLLMTKPEWYNSELPTDTQEVFNKAYENNKLELIANLAAAWDWLDYWVDTLNNSPIYDYFMVFSGSLTYQKAFIHTAKTRTAKLFVFETFFTGEDFYMEEKYDYIANNSDLKYSTFYNSLKVPKDEAKYQELLKKAYGKINRKKNKNVVEPTEYDKIDLDINKKSILLLGQVVNDFSLIESSISSIKHYKDIIDELSDGDFNVIIKTHPWEEKKSNVKSKLTKGILEEYVDTLPDDKKNKFIIIDDYPMKELFKEADIVMGYNSQSLIEASLEGFKPIILGNGFMGGKGFSHDLNLRDIPNLKSIISSELFQPTLTLSEFKNLQDFLIKAFELHLVSNTDNETQKIAHKLGYKIPSKQSATPKREHYSANYSYYNDHLRDRKIKKVMKLVKKPKKFFIDSWPYHLIFKRDQL